MPSDTAAELRAYVATRWLQARVGLLWMAVAGCAWAASARQDITAACASALLAAGLIAQLRLWDDLADRAHDALAHPCRVLVRTTRPWAFIRTCLAMALPIAAGLMLWGGPARLWGYAGLCIALALVYGLRLSRALRAAVVLLKYPAMVWLCAAPADPVRAAWLSAALWLGLGLFDLNDARMQRAQGKAF